jgi:hypothetical protein
VTERQADPIIPAEPLQDFSTSVLVRLIEETLLELICDFRRLPATEYRVDSAFRSVITGGQHPFFNHVFLTARSADGVDAGIEAALTPLRSRNLPAFWWTGFSFQTADLGTRLEAHGLSHLGDWTGMAVDLLALNDDVQAPRGLRIETVGDEQALAQWARTLCKGAEIPSPAADTFVAFYTDVGCGPQLPWRFYTGWLDGEPVAASAIQWTAGVAHVTQVATVIPARRRGIGAMLTLAGLRERRERGYRIGILQASPMGVSVYRRLGFREYCTLGGYVWPGTSEEASAGPHSRPGGSGLSGDGHPLTPHSYDAVKVQRL